MATFPNILDQSIALFEARLTSYRYKIGDLGYFPSLGSDYVASVTHKSKEIEQCCKILFGIDISVDKVENGEPACSC